MTHFHSAKAVPASPDLQVLLAQIAARQSLSPTARAAVKAAYGSETQPIDPEIAAFAAAKQSIPFRGVRSASFNNGVAGTLVTRGQ